MRDVGIIPDDEPAEEPAPSPDPPSTEPGVIPDATNQPSIKAKFGISSSGTADAVTETFTKLSDFIKVGGLDGGAIQLGDWIDLEAGLTVDAYKGEGNFTATNADLGWSGKVLRLIVVGINSFNGLNGNGTTPHVVFQFQNVPVLRRMNATNTNAGGYRDSDMRRYLADVENDGDSGKFLAGLKKAGGPEEVLWAPKRIVSAKEASGSNEISDRLWLPTEWELRGSNKWSVSTDETADNQAWLRINWNMKKHLDGNAHYWEAVPIRILILGFALWTPMVMLATAVRLEMEVAPPHSVSSRTRIIFIPAPLRAKLDPQGQIKSEVQKK